MNGTTFLLAALNETAFYVLGSCLTVLALAVTAIGLRDSDSFSSNLATRAGLLVFAVIVVGTAYFAVDYSEDEQAHREAELAAEEAEEGATELPAGGEVPTPEAAEAEGTPPGQEPSPQTQAPAAKGPGGTVQLAADPTQIAYDKSALSSKPGAVTIDFDNPAQVAHDVAIASGSEEIAKSELVTDGKASVTAALTPGKYVFFCTVPGHREAGMQGTLTVR
ncbi:MAG: plastocyanin/azurin family copper-binding protein [Solirubrobacterales bacterium]